MYFSIRETFGLDVYRKKHPKCPCRSQVISPAAEVCVTHKMQGPEVSVYCQTQISVRLHPLLLSHASVNSGVGIMASLAEDWYISAYDVMPTLERQERLSKNKTKVINFKFIPLTMM